MVDEWLSHIHNNEFVGVLFVDFCKAFDLLDQNLLLQRVERYNFYSSALTWFTSYMADRKQCVKVNGTSSEALPIKSGVTQGSILGPLPFLLFINDLPLKFPLEKTSLFADDTTDSAFNSNVKKCCISALNYITGLREMGYFERNDS